jgi:DHA3 family macrolide efflux protein-like MFS transporter
MMGFLTVGIGLVPSNLFIAGLVLNTTLGLSLPIINGSIGATLQSSIKPDMQGRVFAFVQSAAMLVSPIALIIAGPFADRFGIQPWYLIAGSICALMGVIGFFFPDVMGIENKSNEEKIHAATDPS